MDQDGAFGRVRITPAGNTHALRRFGVAPDTPPTTLA
jgi:hypothetical protein